MNVPYIVIELSGSAQERGRIYGEKGREKILRSIENYKELFMKRANVSWETAKQISRQFIPFIESVYPDGLEEIAGIAEGAGLEFEDILTLNCRSEILFAIPDGCTAVGCLPEFSKNGHTLLGQTWDWMSNSADTIVVLKINQDPLPSMIIFTEAGIIGGKGVNSAGLSVTLNATSTGKGRVGVPLHLIYRSILNQNNFSHAIEAITKVQRAGCGCFNIGSSDGLLASVEFSADDFDVLMPTKEALCHTNHYISTRLFGQDQKYKSTHGHSMVRLNVAQRRAQQIGNLDLDDLKAIFSDHANYPNSVCKHIDPTIPAYDCAITVYTVLMDLDERKVIFYPGNTCEVDPVTFVLS